MAVQRGYLLLVIQMLLIFCHSKAAILPHNLLSAHGKLTQGMMPHGLDLADLSLPPEVITEALFSQTDLLQDKLEQCEEKVRNNLKGDDGAETEGLEDDAEDQIDDDDDDDDDDNDGEDSFDKKIAQLAVDAFDHHGEEDFDDMDGHEASKVNKARGEELASAAAPGREANSSVSEHEDENDDGEKEYIVYEYEDVVDDEEAHDKEKVEDRHRAEESSPHKEDKNNVSQEQINNDKEKVEDRHRAEESSPHKEDKNDVSKEQINSDKDEMKAEKDAADVDDHHNIEDDLSSPQNDSKKENDKENNKQVEENRTSNPPVTSQPTDSEAETDSVDSDAEEPQSTPEEVTITNENPSSEGTPSITGRDKQNTVQGNSVAPDHTSVENSRTTPPPPTTTTTMDSKTTTLQGLTTSKVEPREERPPVPQQKTEKQIGDHHSEGSRHKRSLPLDHIVMAEKADDNLLKEIHGVTFGKGRIRRQASPQEDTKPQNFLVYSKSTDEGEEGTESIESLNEILNPLLMEHREENSENEREDGLQAILKVAEESSLLDLTKTGAETSTRDVLQIAEEFLQKHKPLQPEVTKQDITEVEHLLATATLPNGADRVRRRRSLLGRGLSPERYLPLIDQLVERLNYLQHSVQVCHMLLPPEHLHAANNTAV